ncbi:hypothetical protein D3877_15390 [Azospirillum cavernae]|uniref:Uncharacterized protein n=1 Tax=Azospirillum cavernae TaxID=2320860 RepID=A0A418VWL9_9PROT|nr:hypothetical protein [Azospirillum cavernae]RJF81529.1 hypothetical protein D3877_15390 [Azospirillum cavernae]
MARMLFLRDIDSDVQLRCCACGHSGLLPRSMLVRRFGESYPVLSIAPHYRCSRCDSRDTESRPALVLPTVLEHEDAPDPSFDASLAALNGLLASIRGSDEAEDAPRRANGPPPDSMPDWNLDSSAPLDALPPEDDPPDPLDDHPPARGGLADTDDDEADGLPDWADWRRTLADRIEDPPRKPDRSPPARPLEELVADGPADDADPLWEPVSLAEMADRHGAPPPVVEDEDEVAEDWTPAPRKPAPRAAAIDDVPADETLDAMRRFFAQADLEEEEDAPAPAAKPRPMPAWMDDRDATPDAEPTEDGARATEDSESAFSHKALVRRDFDEDIDDDDTLSEEDFADGDSDDEIAAKADGRGWADILDDEEPTDEEILAFAIRDPEKLAPAPPPPPPPPPPPVRAKAERPAKRAAASAANGEEDGGLDKTIAALRSMIEDAATEPKAAPRRKAKAAPPPVVDEGDSDDGSAPPFAIADDDAPPPPRKPVGKPSASKGGNAKQSAQEREIEEAMKALRDLVEDEDEDDVPPESAAPPRESAKAPRRPAWDEDDDAPPARAPSRRAMDDEPPSAKPPPPPQPTKDGSPLSKTIATLRGMLELDGRKKR